MPSDLRSAMPAESAVVDVDTHSDRREALFTILAASLAVAIVAGIAVLMGMA
jgi:hypothetical protein